MKRVIYVGAFLALVGITIVGCKKDVSKPDPVFDKELNIASDGKMLIFKTTEDYNNVVDNPTEKEWSMFISKVKSMKHTTYAEKLALNKSGESDDLIGDEDLAQILNDEWIVQIGDYLYRVNKPTESVYVLPAANIDEYQDLVSENKNNPHIRKFSTGDPVIELAENGAEGQKSLFCSEDHLGNRFAETNPFTVPGFGDVYWFQGDADYRRYGIYYSIVTTARSNAQGVLRIYVQVENVWHHQRCGNTVGPYSLPWYQSNLATDNFQKHKSYSGSTALNGLHTKFRIRCEVPGVPQGGNSYTTYFTEWRRIQGNNPYFP